MRITGDLRCPHCMHRNNGVIDTSGDMQGYRLRRRRECKECGKRFTTVETVNGVNLPSEQKKLSDRFDRIEDEIGELREQILGEGQ